MSIDQLAQDEILRVGIVSEVHGRIVTVRVDENKNLSDIFLDGEILRNIAVDSFIEIRKGFLSLIGKVDGERIEEEPIGHETTGYDKVDKNRRYLTISLIGYIGLDQKFNAGTKELPLIGNEAYIVTKEQIFLIHNLVTDGDLKISIANTDEEFDIEFPVDTLFNGHIAIFGNTGSGKSNTLASLYQSFVECLQHANHSLYKQNTRFIVFDFNGEYVADDCITQEKKVYKLSTRTDKGDKLPLAEASLLDLEMLSILSDATEKTQKPFLKRTIREYKKIMSKQAPLAYFRKILSNQITDILSMSGQDRIKDLIGFMQQIIIEIDEDGYQKDIIDDLGWHGVMRKYYLKSNSSKIYFDDSKEEIEKTQIYQLASGFEFPEQFLDKFIAFLYMKLIQDILADRVQNEHVAPVVQRLQSKKDDITKVFETRDDKDLWDEDTNFIVIDLNDVKLDMKKTLPLLICKKIYASHKQQVRNLSRPEQSLNIVIDEAHNILSTTSFRESESWKDYRLETFEEIIKEGRKFGVFVTISSQRPSDISPTITSQAHNYFIHRLINKHDLAMISSAVSYIDRITEESIPTLPTGTCIFSGVASQRPIKVHIKELADDFKPQSHTLQFKNLVNKNEKLGD